MAVEILLLGTRNKANVRIVKASDSRVEWERYLIFSTTLWQVQVQNLVVINFEVFSRNKYSSVTSRPKFVKCQQNTSLLSQVYLNGYCKLLFQFTALRKREQF